MISHDRSTPFWYQLTQIRTSHNPEVAGSNPAPATEKSPGNGAFRLLILIPAASSCPTLARMRGCGPVRIGRSGPICRTGVVRLAGRGPSGQLSGTVVSAAAALQALKSTLDHIN
jgi:hypothetical protein